MGPYGGWLVRLGDIELLGCLRWAELNNAKKRGNAVKTRKVDQATSDIEVDYIGKKGEYAVAQCLDIEAKLDYLVGGDQGWDLEYNGRTIDVKVGARLLLFKSLDDFRADIAVLVVPYVGRPDENVKSKPAHAWRDVEVVGWITREEFIAQHEKRELKEGYGVNCVMNPEQMRPMDELVTDMPPDVRAYRLAEAQQLSVAG